MKISRFLKLSPSDYPDKISAVLFTPSCNYKCPACHSKQTMYGGNNPSEKEFFDYLDSAKGWIDGVVMCGGEPTLQPDLPEFMKKIREKGLAIKLDTNGSNPTVLGKLLEEELVDYVAMDIKGPPSLYSIIVGNKIDLRDSIEKSIRITENAPDYEFRTTVVPIKRENGELNWMNQRDAREMAEWAHKHVLDNSRKWYIQKFVARSKDEMLDERFSKENLPKEMHETPTVVLEIVKNAVIQYFPNKKIRE